MVTKTLTALETKDYTFAADAIGMSSPSHAGQLHWEAVMKVVENRAGLRMYLGPWSFLYIPWNQVLDSQTRAGLRDLIRERIGSRAKLAPR